jgi:two-component system nitrate/nitrite response regulator NarL
MAPVNSRRHATVRVGRNSLLAERIARMLDATEFRVAARATDVDHLGSKGKKEHEALLPMLDASHGVQDAVRQVRAFRRLHAEARIVAFTSDVAEADTALLFQAGVDACFAEDVSEAILLKSLELLMLGGALPSAIVCPNPTRPQTQSPEQPTRGRDGSVVATRQNHGESLN